MSDEGKIKKVTSRKCRVKNKNAPREIGGRSPTEHNEIVFLIKLDWVSYFFLLRVAVPFKP
jgi:hypothetical protein